METSLEIDELKEFYEAIKNPLTRRYYTKRLKLFFDYLKLEGDLRAQARDFVSKAKEGRPDYVWATVKLNEYMHMQKSRAESGEISESTLINYYKPVKLFLEENNVLLNWKKISRRIPRGRSYANDRAPDHEEIRQLISYPDARIKSVVLLMSSSGCRLGAFDYLNVGDIEEKAGAAKITIYRGTNDEYFSFITPEAWDALKAYLDHRRTQGEKITKDSPLIRDLVMGEDRWGRGKANRPQRLKSSGVMRLVNDALRIMGIREKLPAGKRRHEFQADHGFRKFFKSVCERQMKSLDVEILLGHNTGLGDNYYRPQEKELLEEYLKAVPELTILAPAQTNAGGDVRQDVEKIVEEVLKEHDEQFARKDSEFKDLERRFEDLEKRSLDREAGLLAAIKKLKQGS